MRELVFASVSVLLILGACAQLPTPAPPAPESGTIAGACANLRILGCPEGYGVDGGESCEVVVARRQALNSTPFACWSTATTPQVARTCGELRCVQ